jgi:dCMP deaminase
MRKVFDDDGNVSQHCVRTLHSEQNAIIQAAKFGIALDGATLYCKITPCRRCAMMIINSGIKRVVCEKHYHADKDTTNLFNKAGIELLVISNKIEKYDRQ